MPSPAPSATRVLLVCSGLDHAHRGFESFARDCFAALRGADQLDIELIKGSGPDGSGERSVRSLTRDGIVARALGRASGREPFRFEQFGFGFSLQPLLARRRPDVVYFSEWHTGLALSFLRRLTNQRFRLVLCNGTSALQGFEHLDRVQELTPAALKAVLDRGADPARHVLLPLGFSISPRLRMLSGSERRDLRSALDLPADRQIIITVAALNRRDKRLDYLINEVARLPSPRPFLLMVGQVETDTPELRRLAAERLGEAGHSMRTVAPDAVFDLLRASDVFVLPSLGEGLPRALVEAMSEGLPCVVHDYAVTRFALGPHGHFADLSRPGALARSASAAARSTGSASGALERHRYVYERFSWDHLRPRYLDLLCRATGDRHRRSTAA